MAQQAVNRRINQGQLVCGCGHEHHHHEEGHQHEHSEECGCGRGHHHHEHEEEHHHGHGETCGCGREHHEHEEEHHHGHGETCGCGREHHEHEEEHHHEHGETCGCGREHHEHEEEHHHEHGETCGCGQHHEEHAGHNHEAEELCEVNQAFDNVKKQVYILENLGCANCAAKMERKIQELPQVDYANIIFATKQLQVVTNTKEELMPVFQEICSSIESEVTVSKRDRKPAVREEKKGGRFGEN